MPSAEAGWVVLSSSALNCCPNCRSITQRPLASTCSPAVTEVVLSGERYQVFSPFDLHSQDGETVLRVVVGDTFDESVQRFGHPHTISSEILGNFHRLDVKPQFQLLAVLRPADLEDGTALTEMKMF